MVQESNCSTFGILPDQGSNLCPLLCQADSSPLSHQGSPLPNFLNKWFQRIKKKKVLNSFGWFRLVAQTVKHLPAMRETQVRFLIWEDPLEKEMAIHSSTLAWRIPWMEDPDRLQSMGSQRVGQDWATSLSLAHLVIFITFVTLVTN